MPGSLNPHTQEVLSSNGAASTRLQILYVIRLLCFKTESVHKTERRPE
jgi:hypothetical protein